MLLVIMISLMAIEIIAQLLGAPQLAAMTVLIGPCFVFMVYSEFKNPPWN